VNTTPKLNKGFYQALSDLNIQKAWIVSPVKEKYKISKGVTVCGVSDFIDDLKNFKSI